MHEKILILGFFVTCVSLSIPKISCKSETWIPEPVRFAMQHAIYIYLHSHIYYVSLSIIVIKND